MTFGDSPCVSRHKQLQNLTRDLYQVDLDFVHNFKLKFNIKINCIYSLLAAITKTCPCNIQRFFSAVKNENSIVKNDIFHIFSPKH